MAIKQINQGIDQVAQVVQQNSATAQESAAASVEMSVQASVLENMISQFKTKDEKAAPASIAVAAVEELPAKRLAAPEKVSYPAIDNTGNFGKY